MKKDLMKVGDFVYAHSQACLNGFPFGGYFGILVEWHRHAVRLCPLVSLTSQFNQDGTIYEQFVSKPIHRVHVTFVGPVAIMPNKSLVHYQRGV